MINTYKRCVSCKYCIERKYTDDGIGIGLCIEPHMPKNAKGESKSTVYLMRVGCPKYLHPSKRTVGRPKKQNQDSEPEESEN